MILQCQRNSFQKEFTTTVKSCQEVPKYVSTPEEKRTKVYEVIPEDTILFPEGGGQPSDRGWLDDEEVIKLERRGEDVVHFVKSPFTAGQTVKQKIDWELRFDRMQQHTESPTGKMMTEKEMKDLEKMVNEHIRDALPIIVNVFEENEPPPKSVRGLPEDHKGQVRVVTISGVEDNMCCGTHLAHLGQLQAIKLLSVDRGKGKGSKSTRSFFLYYVAGGRVLSRLQVSLEKESLEKESNHSITFNTRATNEQLEIMLKYMEDHRDFAHSRLGGPSGRVITLRMWEELALSLNASGCGPSKPALKWQKTWVDWKSKTKKKCLKIRHDQGRTGGGPPTQVGLSPLEERLISFLEASVEGDQTLPEAGLPPPDF
ncbi:hypothetical protein J437_LFUL000600, partial [Ladona fulva]